MFQGTRIESGSQGVEFGEQTGATRLLGLEGLSVTGLEIADDGARVVHVVTADETASACPGCGVFSTSVKAYLTTRPKDVPYGDHPVRLILAQAALAVS